MTTTQTGSRSPEARSPEPLDFLNIDALLSDKELATRGEIRSFVWERVKPNIRAWWEKAIFPREIVPEMGSLGLFGKHLKAMAAPREASWLTDPPARSSRRATRGAEPSPAYRGSAKRKPRTIKRRRG